MSEQLLRERQPFVRADFSHYPNITSDDGEYMVSNGYVYAKIHNSDGSDKHIAGRPVYQRLHQSQTYPTKVPEFCSHEEVREWLLGEARSILSNLQSGKLKAEMSFRFRRCVYDERGLFVEMMQGGTDSGGAKWPTTGYALCACLRVRPGTSAQANPATSSKNRNPLAIQNASAI